MKITYPCTVLILVLFSLLPYDVRSQEDGVRDDNLADTNASLRDNEAAVYHPGLKVQTIFKGLDLPTNMAFVGTNDILVLERWEGTVQRIINGKMLPNPVLDVNVSKHDGLLGIAVAKNMTSATVTTYVFLYFTEAEEKDGGDPIANRLYRYELIDNK